MEASTKANCQQEVEDVILKALDLHEKAEKLCRGYTKTIQTTLRTLWPFQEDMAMEFKELHDLLYKEEQSLMAKTDREEEKVLRFLENKLMDVAETASSVLELVDNLREGNDTNEDLTDMAKSQLEQLSTELTKYSMEMGSCGPEVLCSPLLKYTICKQMLKNIAHSALEHLTLDGDSAHPHLVVSANLKSVKLNPQYQAVPITPQRFQPCLYVLCSQGFQSGKHYWEVSTGQKTNWVLGVASSHVNRKAMENLAPENGYWVLRKAAGNHFYALSSSPVLLAPPDPSPSRIGVFLDYENGKVAFYNAEKMEKICTITGNFQEKLHPFFCPGLVLSEEDHYPLTIHN